MNFARGILETRKQTYKHLSKLLKTIPLETRTIIELSPGNEIQVTTFDANHCVGAVMFLIQNAHGTAVLYTGDTRCESWLVNSLVQNPILVPYTLGQKRLDCLYLDTTFATKDEIHRKFPSKAEGLRELLAKVERYPRDTIFYSHSWTFGYEHVWIALSAALDSRIHLDSYRWHLYKSLGKVAQKGMPEPREASALIGFTCGNHEKSGCLTAEIQRGVKIHSCERGTGCTVMGNNKDVVYITPIISRTSDGIEIAEVGAGGGHGDLRQTHELEITDLAALEALVKMCREAIKEPEALQQILSLISKAVKDGGRIPFDVEDLPELDADEDVSVNKVTDILGSTIENRSDGKASAPVKLPIQGKLPRSIHFPYSRHSSYSELCELVAAFKPRDIHACTVDDSSWTPDVSMRTLFGHLCSGTTFHQDATLLREHAEQEHERDAGEQQRDALNSQRTEEPDIPSSPPIASSDAPGGAETSPTHHAFSDDPQSKLAEADDQHPATKDSQATESPEPETPGAVERAANLKRRRSTSIISISSDDDRSHESSRKSSAKKLRHAHDDARSNFNEAEQNASLLADNQEVSSKTVNEAPRPKRIERWAYDSALGLNGMDWQTFGGLSSTRKTLNDEDEL